MKVSIDDLDVDMQLGNNGVRFAVYGNDGEYMDKLRGRQSYYRVVQG